MSRHRQGFTLIELVITIAIAGILMMMALPVFHRYVENVRVRTAAESFLAGVQTARAEAIRLNSHVEFMLTNSAPSAANSISDVVVNGLVVEATENAVCAVAGVRAARSAQPKPCSQRILPSLTSATDTPVRRPAAISFSMSVRIDSAAPIPSSSQSGGQRITGERRMPHTRESAIRAAGIRQAATLIQSP